MSVINPVPRSTVRLTPSAVAISIWTCVVGIAARDHDHGNGRDDDREQREQAEYPPEAPKHRMSRAG